jgi:hypothetical protein
MVARQLRALGYDLGCPVWKFLYQALVAGDELLEGRDASEIRIHRREFLAGVAQDVGHLDSGQPAM